MALADRLRGELEHAPPRHDNDDVLDGDVVLVADALAGLDGDDRELITLIAWERLSPSEAAVVLGISAPAARKRLQRARQRLRALLGDAPTTPTTMTAVSDAASCGRSSARPDTTAVS